MGKRSSENIEAALESIGKDLSSFQNILDFGCRCGRTLLWFAGRPQSYALYGTADIDAEAISWCRNNLDFAEFGVNDALPPLD
ncbi:MAG: class I SAM-dependent methyltransferase, partial [Actinomycetota bacterium]|nr:class I SAM-dependent methyltransferase [Actinomycetota bacterium]